MCISTYCTDSDSDSEKSVDEHNSSYASSHSSDSEEEKKRSTPKWNNERSPVHSTPNGTAYIHSETIQSGVTDTSTHLAPGFTQTQDGKSTI